MAARSAHVPYGVGLVTSAPRAWGCSWKAASNACAEGGWARFTSGSHCGSTQMGRTPDKIRPDTSDLWASRPTSISSCGPATDSMAALTDKELPYVEKKV